MRWILTCLLCVCMPGLAKADSGDDAAALTLELIERFADIGGITLNGLDELEAHANTTFDLLSTEADATDATWAVSYGIDVKAESVTRHDADGVRLDTDPASLDEDQLMPAPVDWCEDPVSHPVSDASTVETSWQRCTGLADGEDGPLFEDFAELLYGEDGNYRRVRVGVVLTSNDPDYLDRMSGEASALLSHILGTIDAEALAE